MKITKTISIAGRFDICSFATLARCYEDEGMRMRSKSDILWQAVEQLASAYCNKRGEEPFTDIREALEYMDSIGIPLDTNMRALREVTSAKIYQDSGEDYGIEQLYAEAETVAIRHRRRKKLSRLNSNGVDIDDNRARYKEVSDEIKAIGGAPISYEEFIRNKQIIETKGRDAIVETINEIDFAEKEAARLQEEKEATSPAALLAALNKKGG